jgi:hypothetical protein
VIILGKRKTVKYLFDFNERLPSWAAPLRGCDLL